MDTTWRNNFKLSITNGLIVSYIIIFILQYVYGFSNSIRDFGLNAAKVVEQQQYWRICTAAFLHGDVIHVLMNSYFIYIVGNGVEAMLGKIRYVLLVIVTIITSSLMVVGIDLTLNQSTYTIGASGFGYGLIGLIVGFAIMYPHRYYRRLAQSLLYNIVIYSVIYVFFSTAISWSGHLGGFVGGLITALVLNAFFRKDEW